MIFKKTIYELHLVEKFLLIFADVGDAFKRSLYRVGEELGKDDYYNQMNPDHYFALLELYHTWVWGNIFIMMKVQEKGLPRIIHSMLGETSILQMINMLSMSNETIQRGFDRDFDDFEFTAKYLGHKCRTVFLTYFCQFDIYGYTYDKITKNCKKQFRKLLVKTGIPEERGDLLEQLEDKYLNNIFDKIKSIGDNSERRFKDTAKKDQDNIIESAAAESNQKIMAINEHPFFNNFFELRN